MSIYTQYVHPYFLTNLANKPTNKAWQKHSPLGKGKTYAYLYAVNYYVTFGIWHTWQNNYSLNNLNGYYNCDSTSITTTVIKITIRLQFDFDSTRQSGHHDSILVKVWIHTKRHFTSEVGKRLYQRFRRMLPDVDPSVWMPFLLPWRIHYYVIKSPDHWLLYWIRRLLTRRIKVESQFWQLRRSWIEAESQSNRNCNSHFTDLV